MSGVLLAEVSFSKKEAKVWGKQSHVSDIIEAVEDVGFEAILNDVRHHKGGQDVKIYNEGEPDVSFKFIDKLNPVIDHIKIKNTLMSVDGVMSVDLMRNSFGNDVVNVWGCIDVDMIHDTLKSSNYNIQRVIDHGSDAHKIEPEEQNNILSTRSNDYDDNCYVLPLLVTGMSCANCSKAIENKLLSTTGVVNVRIALLSGKVEIYFDKTIVVDSDILDDFDIGEMFINIIESLGYFAKGNGKEYKANAHHRLVKTKKIKLNVSGMTSYSHAEDLESMIRPLPGIMMVSVNLLTEMCEFDLNDSVDSAVGARDVMKLIEDKGYIVKHILNDNVDDQEQEHNQDVQEWWRLLIICLFLGGPVVILHFSMIFSDAIMDFFNIPVSLHFPDIVLFCEVWLTLIVNFLL